MLYHNIIFIIIEDLLIKRYNCKECSFDLCYKCFEYDKYVPKLFKHKSHHHSLIDTNEVKY